MGKNPSSFKGWFGTTKEDHPVEPVSWDDAQKFLKMLNQMEKTDKYRLPTEAEWEYACRAGGAGAFCFGDDAAELEKYAWYDKNSAKKTHPVGQLQPNVWGLCDIHGNVLEWCQDWYGPYAVGPVVDPKGPDAGPGRVLRGGSWLLSTGPLRSADRDHGNPDARSDDIGFRVARTL